MRVGELITFVELRGENFRGTWRRMTVVKAASNNYFEIIKIVWMQSIINYNYLRLCGGE